MKGLPFVLAFTAMTFVAWGAYGPLLHHGTLSMGKDSLRAFVGVGIAYFFIAVLVPVYILRTQGETGKWTVSGTFYSLIAGAVGALGALGVILALSYGGLPVYVMPLVFGFAPIVNTLVTAWMSKTFDQISPIFISGIVVASLGVAGVLAFKPVAPPHATHPASDTKSDGDNAEKSPKNEHARVVPTGSWRFVTTLTVQEPVAGDALPPVVVQPAAPDDRPVVPQTESPQPTPATEKPTASTAEQQELPPVVVQPAAPEISAPAVPAPAPTAAPQEPKQSPSVEKLELPPTVVQPAPLQQTVEAAPKTTAPVDVPKAEPQPEATKPEAAKPELTKPEPAKPEPAKPEPAKPEPEKSSVSDTGKMPVLAPAESASPVSQLERFPPADEPAAKPAEIAEPSHAATKTPAAPNVLMIILSIVIAAICWGSYGPMLHQGQARMGGSRLRPFTCVGLAYFIIAIAAPLAVIYARTADTGSWSIGGLSWSIVAGAAGAIGALGVILAFNAGGKPYYVMPLVFGFAPVINTCISLTENRTWGLATPMFWISLAVVIAGAITVLLNAPKPKHVKPAT